jgi:hypothetical protein
MTGYIKIYRSLLGHWIIEDADKFRKWMIILLSVNYKPAKVAIGNSLYTVDAGQAMFSIQTWADKLGTSKKGVLAFFDLLKKDGMISTETVGKGNRSSTRVTVENYACYQGTDAPEELPQGKRKGNREGIREGITSKEREESKEEKEGKNKPVYTDEFLKFWNIYPRKEAKPDAFKAFKKIKPEELDKILRHVPMFCHGKESQYIPHPASYLNKRRWEDEQAQTETRSRYPMFDPEKHF